MLKIVEAALRGGRLFNCNSMMAWIEGRTPILVSFASLPQLKLGIAG